MIDKLLCNYKIILFWLLNLKGFMFIRYSNISTFIWIWIYAKDDSLSKVEVVISNQNKGDVSPKK